MYTTTFTAEIATAAHPGPAPRGRRPSPCQAGHAHRNPEPTGRARPATTTSAGDPCRLAHRASGALTTGGGGRWNYDRHAGQHQLVYPGRPATTARATPPSLRPDRHGHTVRPGHRRLGRREWGSPGCSRSSSPDSTTSGSWSADALSWASGHASRATRGCVRDLSKSLGPDETNRLYGTELARFLPDRTVSSEVESTWGQSGLFEAVLALVGRLADESPVVLVLEDAAHWAGRYDP